MSALEAAAAELRKQGCAYPNASATLVMQAVEAAGFAVVQLPEPHTPHPSWRGTWFGGDAEDVYAETKHAVFDPGGDIIISGVTRLTRADARSLAGTLLAAADAAEAAS